MVTCLSNLSPSVRGSTRHFFLLLLARKVDLPYALCVGERVLPVHGGMDKLVQFGRKAWFIVRVMSGYEERRIRSYRLQLQKRLEMASTFATRFHSILY